MSVPGSPRQVQWIGNQEVEQEGSDLLIIRARGEATADAMRQLVLADRELARRNGYSLILIDGTLWSTFGAGARQATFDEMKRHSGYLGSTAIFGLSGTMVWLMRLVLRGMLLLGSYLDDEVQMFATEPEARAFLAARRPQRQKQAAQRRVS